MTSRLIPLQAAEVLYRGGVVAYPTEGVWGLGCDPFDETAVQRLLAIKQRPVDKGLILIAGALDQFDGLLDWDALADARAREVLATWPGPHTWIMPTTGRVPAWITGAHAGVAARVSAHPEVVALCAAFGGPLVSTSANLAGVAPPRSAGEFDPGLLQRIDGLLSGDTGGLSAPTPIRDARSGALLRGV